MKQTNNKLKFQMDCTKMRKQEGGEWLWNYFMTKDW